MLKELVVKNRSYRRFDENVPISTATLQELVDLARLCASGANRQPLKYLLSNTPEQNALIFPHLAWAGYLTDWAGPAEGERPTAYIVMVGDTAIAKTFGCDHGIAAQTILLGAAELGLGGCMIASIQLAPLREALHLDERYEIVLVLALGKPKESVVIESVAAAGDIKYWRDAQGVHHVPKRALAEIRLD